MSLVFDIVADDVNNCNLADVSPLDDRASAKSTRSTLQANVEQDGENTSLEVTDDVAEPGEQLAHLMITLQDRF